MLRIVEGSPHDSIVRTQWQCGSLAAAAAPADHCDTRWFRIREVRPEAHRAQRRVKIEMDIESTGPDVEGFPVLKPGPESRTLGGPGQKCVLNTRRV